MNGSSWWEDDQATQSSTPQKRNRKFLNGLRRGPVALMAMSAFLVPTALGALALSPDSNAPERIRSNILMHPATVPATLAQCGGTFSFDISPSHYGVIPDDYDGDIPRHEMIVPSYGYSTATADEPRSIYFADDKDLPSHPEVMNWMRQGHKIIWYPRQNNEDTSKLLTGFVESHPDFIALPWVSEYAGLTEDATSDDDVRPLPLKRALGFSAWGYSMSCDTWNEVVVEDFGAFVDERQDLDAYPTLPARLDEDGKLQPIQISRR